MSYPNPPEGGSSPFDKPTSPQGQPPYGQPPEGQQPPYQQPGAGGAPQQRGAPAPYGTPPAYGQPGPYNANPYGAPGPYGYQGYGPPPRPTNGMAIASMVLGILWIWWIGSILALIFGYVARSQIRQRNESGGGMAIAGIVLGWIGVGFLVLVIILAVVGRSTYPY